MPNCAARIAVTEPDAHFVGGAQKAAVLDPGLDVELALAREPALAAIAAEIEFEAIDPAVGRDGGRRHRRRVGSADVRVLVVLRGCGKREQQGDRCRDRGEVHHLVHGTKY